NNVRLKYRQGTGLAGNLAPGSLTRLAKPHRLVAAVRQPLAATGGNDREGVPSLRENAPATLLTLERAVSLEDFSYLAMSHSSVWQARAFIRPTGLGREIKIEVVVVPAGGGNLGSLAQTLTDFLMARAIPGAEVMVLPYQSRTFALEVLISVNAQEYNPEAVMTTVKTALKTKFSLERRKLGQDLFLSEVYQVVEGVTGVIHSRAVINGQGAIRRVAAEDREVLILGNLAVDYEGRETSQTEATVTTPAEPLPLNRLVGKRPVRLIQGVGPQYASLLQAAGIRTLTELVRLDPAQAPAGITPIRLAEFKTKAGLVLSLDLDKSLMSPLLSRSLAELLLTDTQTLAQNSGLGRQVIEALQTKLRILQIAMDEEYLPMLTLRELLTELGKA
ncbi:MAG: baseplate J/gp47 family protein, partial [Desulfobacca sp.]|nr:baseplate J/gp47 family protein [Desulfobacca sp.]